MKGASQLVSHSSLLIISIIAMGMIVSGVSDYLFSTETTITRLELNNVANIVKSNLIKVYSVANSSSPYISGKFHLPVAERVGSNRVLIEANSDNFTLSVNLRNEKIEITRSYNIDANITGRAYLPASFELEKIDQNITIRLVE